MKIKPFLLTSWMVIALCIITIPFCAEKVASAETKTAKPVKYIPYVNERYGFSIEVPADFVLQELFPDGDGTVMNSRDGKSQLRLWGGNNDLEETPRQAMERERLVIVEKGARIGIQAIVKGGSGYVLSWSDHEKMGYQKCRMTPEEYCAFRLVYPKAQNAYYEPVIVHLAKSLELSDKD